MDARALLIHAQESQLRGYSSALSLKGWRVFTRPSRAEGIALLQQEPLDVVIVHTGGGILAADLLWMLEELNALSLEMPLVAITDQHHLFDGHRLLRRDVLLLHPSAAPDLAEHLTQWYMAHKPLKSNLADLLSCAQALALNTRMSVEVDGQRLGTLSISHGVLMQANAPGLRGARALQFLERLDQADVYLQPLAATMSDAQEQDSSLLRWRSQIKAQESAHPEVQRAIEQMLYHGIARLGTFGLLDKRGLSSQPSQAPQALASAPEQELGLHEDTAPSQEARSPTIPPQAAAAAAPSARQALAELTPKASEPISHQQTHSDGRKTQPKAPAPEQASETDPYERLYKEATLAYIRRDHDRALALFKQCAAQRPDDKRVTHNLEQLLKRHSKS